MEPISTGTAGTSGGVSGSGLDIAKRVPDLLKSEGRARRRAFVIAGLIITVPEADELVGGAREKYDPVAGRGIPAHVTVLYPYLPAGRIDDGLVAELRVANDRILGKEIAAQDAAYLQNEAQIIDARQAREQADARIEAVAGRWAFQDGVQYRAADAGR